MTVRDDPFTAIEKTSLEQYRPLRAMLELTYRCNFRCVHCYLVEFRSPGELSTSEVRGVMEQLAEMGCLVLTLTGGEPLVRRDFFEIATAARDLHFALRIFTNGSLVDSAVADKLALVRPLSTEVSLYGITDSTYAAVTGRRQPVAPVLEAVRLLRERDLPVMVKLPVLQQNVHEVDAIRDFAHEVGAGFAANPNITPKDDGDMGPLAHALDDRQLGEYYTRYEVKSKRGKLKPDGLMCNTARNALVVSPTGDIFPCVQIKQSVGNVRDSRIHDIWHGESPLLSELRSLRVRDYPSCAGCGKRSPSGAISQCAGVALATSGSLTGGDRLAERHHRVRSAAMLSETSS